MADLETKTIAAMLSVCTHTVRLWIRRGLLKGYHRGGKCARLRVPADELALFLARNPKLTQRARRRRTAATVTRADSITPTPARVPDPLEPTD